MVARNMLSNNRQVVRQWTYYLPTGLDNLPAATAHTNSSRQLMMMGTWLPETCWATIRREIKNTKSYIQLVFLIHTELRCTVNHTSDLLLSIYTEANVTQYSYTAPILEEPSKTMTTGDQIDIRTVHRNTYQSTTLSEAPSLSSYKYNDVSVVAFRANYSFLCSGKLLRTVRIINCDVLGKHLDMLRVF